MIRWQQAAPGRGDEVLDGVGIKLGISFVTPIFYVVVSEAVQAMAHMDFASS